MRWESPLRARHERYAGEESARLAAMVSPRGGQAHRLCVSYLPYATDTEGAPATEVVADFGSVEAEYAALRRGAGLIEEPQTGVLVVNGKGRIEFLQRMLTQDLSGMAAGEVRRAFLLNRKGRIEGDLVLAEATERMFVLVDITRAAAVAAALAGYLFGEEVEVLDSSEQYFVVGAHGPHADGLLRSAGLLPDAPPENQCRAMEGGLAIRDDALGIPGIRMVVARARATDAWDTLCATARPQGSPLAHTRPVGWYAANIVRIEEGLPRFGIDFGKDSLPHETGVLAQRVSFRKGCYVGQEVVARMESRGRAKQRVAALRVEGGLLPSAGEQVFRQGDAMGEAVGAITSSTLSPMLGASPIAFATLRDEVAAPQTRVRVNAEGSQADAIVQAGLRFLGAIVLLPQSEGGQSIDSWEWTPDAWLLVGGLILSVGAAVALVTLLRRAIAQDRQAPRE